MPVNPFKIFCSRNALSDGRDLPHRAEFAGSPPAPNRLDFAGNSDVSELSFSAPCGILRRFKHGTARVRPMAPTVGVPFFRTVRTSRLGMTNSAPARNF